MAPRNPFVRRAGAALARDPKLGCLMALTCPCRPYPAWDRSEAASGQNDPLAGMPPCESPVSAAMLTEIDIYCSTNVLLKRHGPDAPIHAAMLEKGEAARPPAPPRPPGRHARRRRSAGYSRIVGAHLTFDRPTLYRCGRTGIAASL